MKHDDPIYCASMSGAEALRSKLFLQGLHLNVIPSIDGRTHPWKLAGLSPAWAHRGCKSAFEYGVCKSHAEVIEAAEGQDAFFLEDNVRIHKDWSKQLKMHCEQQHTADVILLGCLQFKWDGIQVNGSYPARFSRGAFGYWLAGDMQARMVKDLRRFNIPVEHYFMYYLQREKITTVLRPNLVILNKQSASRMRWEPENYV